MAANLITPVTNRLRKEIEATSAALKAVDVQSKFNDQNDYADLVNHLESLTVAVLSATSSAHMSGPREGVASFDIGPGSELSRLVAECVSYLRDTASELLAAGKFSAYERNHASAVLALLKHLYSLLRRAISYQARADINKITEGDVGEMLTAFDTLAQVAAGQSPEPPTWCEAECCKSVPGV